VAKKKAKKKAKTAKKPKAEEQKPNKPKSDASHLKDYQFKPGESGNPGGRPKGSVNVSAILKRKFAEAKGKDGKTMAEMLVDVALAKALRGDFKVIDALFNRHEGKAVDKKESVESTEGMIYQFTTDETIEDEDDKPIKTDDENKPD